jgi:hypothetical protein
MKPMSTAQRKARERFPNAGSWPHDFSLARGYAICFEQRVDPLVDMLRIARGAINLDAHSQLIEKIDNLLNEQS